jgi:uncharacterized protein (DUF924 family)
MDIFQANEILNYWFPKDGKPDYNKWFIKSKDYDNEIKRKFGKLLKEAEKGKGYGWLVNKDSYVAYIILMDQFSRHIYRGKGDSFKNDKGVMIFTEMGFDLYKDDLKGYEFMFAFMPYMHTENLKYQKKGKCIFEAHKNLYGNNSSYKRQINKKKICNNNNLTQNDKEFKMLQDMENHVNGHLQTIKIFGRFPKRNKALNRISSPEEIKYMENPEVQKRPY